MSLAFLNNISGIDGLVLLMLGLLIFGRRLPEVARELGQTIIDFKNALSSRPINTRSADEFLFLAIIVLLTIAAIALLSGWRL